MIRFVYYQKTMVGRWSIRGSVDKPSEKAAEGARRKICNIIELPEEHRQLDLDGLAELYPLNQKEEI